MGVIQDLRVEGHLIGKLVVTRRQLQHVGNAREKFRTGFDDGDGNGKQPHNLLLHDSPPEAGVANSMLLPQTL
jgi:hypothetical protein